MVLGLLALACSYQSALDDALNDPALAGSLTGVCVMDLDGNVEYSKYADVRLVPASNQKLLTAVFAIETLGMEFRPKTRFWKEKKWVFVDAVGDPTVTREQLLKAKAALKIKAGTAIRVRQAFRPDVPPSWEYDDLPNRYASRVTAFSFDRGGFEIWSKNGRLKPLDPAYRITLRHVAAPGSPHTKFNQQTRTAVVTGTLPKGEQLVEAFALPDPDVTAARTLGGPLFVTSAPAPKRKPDYVIEGQPLAEAMKFCLERSDNSYAEHFLLMSASKEKPLGEKQYEDAAARLTGFLVAKAGLETGSVAPIDGSGMSRHDLVTPSALCKLLAWAYQRPWKDGFLACLAAGGEGTLESRLGSSTFVGKTGTLSAVSCLTGYVRSGTGKTLVVSMLFNNTLATPSQVRAIQDRVIDILERG